MADAGQVDESLLVRVAALSPAGQRWLKTTIQAIGSSDVRDRDEPAPRPVQLPPKPRRLPKPAPADLEDVITGKADLRDQLDAYPELSNELDGLADVIDLLREAGERRRKRGEDVLRELLEGNGEPADDAPSRPEQQDEEQGEDEERPRRPRR
jgi:hypothetical protein